jgi:hypothetical protein
MTAPQNRRLTPPRVLAVTALVAVAVAAAVLLSRPSSGYGAPLDPVLPDLVMGPIEEVMGGLEELTGNPVVRVEATIVNKGPGVFLLSARRDFPWTDHWTVYQQLTEGGGGSSELTTAADLIFAGSPHSHWHVKNMESHRLERPDTGEVLSEVIKQGFCPYDTDPYYPDVAGAPTDPIYNEADCEGPAWVTELNMGVSVGWGDKYPWHMIEQSIGIANVPDGTYRILEIADPFDWFEESDETNNQTWVDVAIDNSSGIPSVRVVDRAPSP